MAEKKKTEVLVLTIDEDHHYVSCSANDFQHGFATRAEAGIEANRHFEEAHPEEAAAARKAREKREQSIGKFKDAKKRRRMAGKRA